MGTRRARTASALLPGLVLAAGLALPARAQAATPCPDPGYPKGGSLSLGIPAAEDSGPPTPIALSVANSSPQTSGFALPDTAGGFSDAPAAFQKSGPLEDDCVWIHLEGADPTVRLRLAPHADVSAHTHLELTLQAVAPVSGDLTLYFLDHEWKEEIAASELVTLPGSALVPGAVQTLSLPLADFASPVFDDSELTDVVIGLAGAGGSAADLVIGGLRAAGAPPEGVEPLAPVVLHGSGIRLVSLSVLEVTLDGNVSPTVGDDPATWSVYSSSDAAYAGAPAPVAVSRFTSTWSADAGNDGEPAQSEDDVIRRHVFALTLPTPLLDGHDYTVEASPLLALPEALAANPDWALSKVAGPDGPQAQLEATVPDPSPAYFWQAVAEPPGWQSLLQGTVELDPIAPWKLVAGYGGGAAAAIKVNQHGYHPESAERYAYVGYWLGAAGALPLPGPFAFEVREVEAPPPSEDGAPPVVGRSPDDPVVLAGTATPRIPDPADPEVDPFFGTHDDAVFSGEQVLEIDLAALAPGTYYLEVEGIGRSGLFRVGGAYEAFHAVTRGLYHQRCSTPLEPAFTAWPRDECHAEASVLVDGLDPAYENWGRFFAEPGAEPPDPGSVAAACTLPPAPESFPAKIEGGWHDAGDYDRRPLHLDTVMHLLLLASMFPERLGDGTLEIPESGNGLPDVLDEALYGLALWRALQEPNGAVRAGTESHGHPQTGPADLDAQPYWTYTGNRWTSYRYAGAAAHAARALELFPEVPGALAEAADLRLSAEAAWSWAESQTEHGTTGPNQKSEACLQAEIAAALGSGDAEQAAALEAQLDQQQAARARDIGSARLLAAGELFATTGDPGYQDAFAALWTCADLPSALGDCTGLQDRSVLTHLGMAVAEGETVDVALRQSVRDTILGQAASWMAVNEQNRYRHARRPHYGVTWGNATNPAGQFLLWAIVAHHLAPDPAYLAAVSLNADFQLGAHPWSRSWITGLGRRPPETVLHLDSNHDAVAEPVPGLPVYGPFAKTCDPGDTYWQCLVYNYFHPPAGPDLPPVRHYSPWVGMAPMAEFTVWGDQGPAAVVYGFLYAVSDESPQALAAWPPEAYPRHAGTLVPCLGEDCPPCSNGLDDDGDGAADFPEDAGCLHPQWPLEDPACSNGLDDDSDGLIDAADPLCAAGPWITREAPKACGLGLELGLLAPLLAAWGRRLPRGRPAPRRGGT